MMMGMKREVASSTSSMVSSSTESTPTRNPDLPKISFISHNHGYPPNGGDFEFIPPPDAPVFRPTEEEFAEGPIAYVAKIKPLAEGHGICKIIPPKSFEPPFAVDVESFRFTPRVQRLNELEAQTRIKLNFLEQVVKFWDLQGSNVKDKVRRATLKIPSLERKTLDLYMLHKVVQEEGGFEICTRDKKWSRVAVKMGYNTSAQNKGPVASLLRQHYERILFPYDVFLSGATIGPDTTTPGHDENSTSSDTKESDQDGEVKVEVKVEKSDDEATPCKRDKLDLDDNSNSKSPTPGIEPKSLRPSPRRLARRMQPGQRFATMSGSPAANKELKKLQVYGAGPKMPGFVSSSSDNDNPSKASSNVDSSSHSKVLSHDLRGLNVICSCLRPAGMCTVRRRSAGRQPVD